LNDLTFQIIIHAVYIFINRGSKHCIADNTLEYAPSWRFYLYCAIEEPSSPDIQYTTCLQVLRLPSEHGTSSMGKHFLATGHIAKLNKLTDLEVSELTSSMADETACAILKRQGSHRIRSGSSQRKFTLDFHFQYIY
jgi:hypothetical protein